MRTSLLVGAITLLPVVADAQKDKDKGEPKRPALAAGADTNSAQAYHDHGLNVLRSRPDEAANAFYWASRLNPITGESFYARRVALLLSDRRRLSRYWSGDRSTIRSAEIKRIDSLYLHALTLNPFLYEGLDQHLLAVVIDEYAREEERRTGASAHEISYYIEGYFNRAGDATRAWRAYTSGQFTDALMFYAKAIKTARYKAGLRSMRGRLFYQLASYDSALSELTQAVDEMRKRDVKEFVYVYDSKALGEHTVGMAHERRGDTAAARAAYGRALQEDLAYSPAHVRLGYMAMDAKDTTTALSEFDLAVQLRPDDSGLRFQYGYILVLAGKATEALEQADKGIAQNPWFASLYYLRAAALDKLGEKADALQDYKGFLALAARTDLRRAEVAKRIEALSAGGN